MQRWIHGYVPSHDCVHVRVGRLPDGRWFAERGREARAYPDEESARAVAANLMAEHEDWQEVPAEPGARGGMAPPGWRLAGQTWFREDQLPPAGGLTNDDDSHTAEHPDA